MRVISLDRAGRFDILKGAQMMRPVLSAASLVVFCWLPQGVAAAAVRYGETPERGVVQPPGGPQRFTATRDVVIVAVQRAARARGFELDYVASRPDQGVLVFQPHIFTKGAVASSALRQITIPPDASAANWTRGRYTFIIEVQQAGAGSSDVSISATIEGRRDTPAGAEWAILRSNGSAEAEFTRGIMLELRNASTQ